MTNTNNTKTNELVNSIINIETAKHKNVVEVVKGLGTEINFLKINGMKVGAIGGSEKDILANQRQIQFMVDQCETTDPMEICKQLTLLQMAMADLHGVDLDDTILKDGVEYIIDSTNGKVYNEGGDLVINIKDVAPELAEANLPEEAMRAILVAEINKLDHKPIAEHHETPEKAEGDNTYDINADQKLSVIDTIKGLRALGMDATWFNVNGVRQRAPICYDGESDLLAFTNVVKAALKEEKGWLDVVLASCHYAENGLSLDEVADIDGTEVLLDYTKKECWTTNGVCKLADIADIEYDLPQEAVKIMLLTRTKEELDKRAEEARNYGFDLYEDDYDEEDEDWEF